MKQKPDHPARQAAHEKLQNLEKHVIAGMHDMVIQMTSRQLIALMQNVRDELERCLNPRTLH